MSKKKNKEPKVDPCEERLAAIFGGRNPWRVTREEGMPIILEHLSKNLGLPCAVKGIEDFDWEEFYVVGPGDPEEYRELRKTCPSYRDEYDLLGIELGPSSEWMLFPDEDIAAHVRRRSDGLEFCLGLAELKAVDEKSRNAQILDDYVTWFVNSR